MDLWGQCDVCDRWFYMASQSDQCPVCQRTPVSVVDRDEDSTTASTQ